MPRKSLYTLCVDDYAPAIRDLTFPLLQYYANKIGAEFVVITERKRPDWPVTIEKFQVAELAEQRGDEWSIFVDADALISTEMFDPTDHLGKDTIAHNGKDLAGVRWSYDKYFRRDGRHFSSCTWLVIASEWCVADLWRLPELTLAETVSRIHITNNERVSGYCKREHLIDDYTLSRNIARFGLHATTVSEICANFGPRDVLGRGVNPHLFHLYSIPEREKIDRMLQLLSTPPAQGPNQPNGWGLMTAAEAQAFKAKWGFARATDYQFPEPPIPGWMSIDELVWLYETAKECNQIVEIGCWKGRSTHALLSGNLKQKTGRVVAVDHFKGSLSEMDSTHREAATVDVRKVFRENCGLFPNLIIHACDSKLAAAEYPGNSFDMVFIDGEHTTEAVLSDLRAWAPKVKAGGIICGHDGDAPGVRAALQEFFGGIPPLVAGSIWRAFKE